ILSEANLLVHTSRQEPLGRVLLESAASGVPIIATNVGGTCEIVEDRTSAWLVDPDKPTQVADAMIGLYGNESLRHQLTSAARQRVEKLFNSELAAENLVQFWRRNVNTR